MKRTGNEILLSASDLSNHSACHHLTVLNLQAAHGLVKPPRFRDESVAIIQERGLEFEREYLRHLEEQGFVIAETTEENISAINHTIESMRAGADIIYQASLQYKQWQGRADFLQKVQTPSNLGNWSYEVGDTKLARETRIGTILQLCLYSDMIAAIQGIMPEYMHVITPANGFTKETYRVDEFLAYYRLIQQRLQKAMAAGVTNGNTYPNPVPHCDICRWWSHCDKQRHADDHLSLVAGLSNIQTTEINKWHIETVREFAELPLPLPYTPSRGSVDTYERLHEQARIQVASRVSATPRYELLDLEPGTGLFNLPEPSPGDIFFDFEGDPFVGTSGIEYLFGWTTFSASKDEYERLWAMNANEEKKAFETFVNWVTQRLKAHPDMHIYHYTAYEPSALKRLMGKYATHETEIDEWLRGGVFVDLHTIVKQALRAGVESYSLKQLELLHGFERSVPLEDASQQRHMLEILLERNTDSKIPPETIHAVEIYNMEDCISTRRLRDWLEMLRNQLAQAGNDIPRPKFADGQANEKITGHQEKIKPVFDALTNGVPLERSERTPEQHAQWLLANMLDWYRREKKSFWWEYFRLHELSNEELLDEKGALAGLQYTGKREIVLHKRTGKPLNRVIDEYLFPAQECDVRAGDDLMIAGQKDFGEVASIDRLKGMVRIKKLGPMVDAHPAAVFRFNNINDTAQENAIFRIAHWVMTSGIDSEGEHRAARDLLLNLPPRSRSVFTVNGNRQEAAVAWGNILDNGVLPIQGPPGSGKSYTAAKMIVSMIKAGKRIGITALSHKVIRGLLDKVLKDAGNEELAIRCVHCVTPGDHPPHPAVHETKDYGEVLQTLQSNGVQVVAGTAWLWARGEFANSVDVLFADEAGQLSLIDTIAVSQAAKNLVLLGDPQQLKQPQQGSHPEGTEASALGHILGEHKTIPSDRGIFLDKTWRMHPAICSFISEMFYERRLQPLSSLSAQRIDGNTVFRGAGLWFEAVTHTGNRNSSAEEAARIASIIAELTKGDVTWTNRDNETRPLAITDILVIAPYNAQVVLLMQHLPVGTHIGTVDKFQGQEAPVVIFSMSTSLPEDAPRGMEFLYSLNRLNVAVSRAKAVCIIVANPVLLEPSCKSPDQARLANAFCRYKEVANEGSVASPQ